VNYIWQQAALCQHRTTVASFSFTLFGKANINPTSKEILGIPFRFTVAEQDKFEVSHGRSLNQMLPVRPNV
jgi:hypothetical protein